MELHEKILDELLDAIERSELRLLKWGYVDGSLSEADVDALADSVLKDHNQQGNAEDLVEPLVENRLLFEIGRDSTTIQYRSRFAEGVRLLTRVKQLFPNRAWLAAPDLVSGFRVDARSRTVPRRDISSEDALSHLRSTDGWTRLSEEIADAILGSISLSGFQLRATTAILRNLQTDVGTVLTAGTGAGKTIAFYLPAALTLAPLIATGEHWVKAVALYPRVELLKDQFTQALRLLTTTAHILVKHGKRPFRLGTLFGLTPYDAHIDNIRDAKWEQRSAGFVCPFLLCPQCGAEMLWRQDDITRSIERLTCLDDCGREVGPDEVVLTRIRASHEPPDIVFTTGEMLNQRLSDTWMRHLFGISFDQAKRAKIVLLDEVHTYGGTSGAQMALVVRRWRNAVGRQTPVHFVGLSATLEDAPRFFSDLTGVWSTRVSEVAPLVGELEPQAMEYQLVLRGNPAAQTQLLSTTIQTSFLAARMLDPRGDAVSGGRFGQRTFVFTDDLDATNRLYDFLKDAEAYDLFGRPDPARQPLAALRGPDHGPTDRMKDNAGQRWSAIERIGRPLAQRLGIGRVSSQDRGVNATSDIFVATAALEVGFNDTTVGAIVQHKSPHNLASFVQRRGRAGRTESMRPWMITVLSDFGRDRQTFQTYDRLFDPTLRPISLPIHNQYVLRMQAALAVLDWLAARNQSSKGWWWPPASGPATTGPQRNKQTMMKSVIDEVLSQDGPRRKDLANHIRWALLLGSQEAAVELLWSSPRGLMFEVLPTLARRLATDWAMFPTLASNHALDRQSDRIHPMPEFLPANLFSDLNLPEVAIRIPPATRIDTETVNLMPIEKALAQLVPGRVTRRFAIERGKLNHWVPVPLPLADGDNLLPVQQYAEEAEFVALVPVLQQDGTVLNINCYRPWRVALQRIADRQVLSTSNAWQAWRTNILPQGDPVTLAVAHDPTWGSVVPGIHFHTHALRAPVTIRRFATHAVASVKTPPPTRQEFRVRTFYTEQDGTQAALGYEIEVDAVSIPLALPSPGELADRAVHSAYLPAWRTAYFRHRIQSDPVLEPMTNTFQRDWLYQFLLATLVHAAVSDDVSLDTALRSTVEKGLADELRDIAVRLADIDFGFMDEDAEDDEDPPSAVDEDARANLERHHWAQLLDNEAIVQRLANLAPMLWNPGDDWADWLHSRVHETLGEAMLAAAYHSVPSHTPDGALYLDLSRGIPGASPDGEIWLTESTLGGAGVVQAIAETATADPRRFLSALEAAVAPDAVELVAQDLERFVLMLDADTELAALLATVRDQDDYGGRVAGMIALFDGMSRRGFSVGEEFKASMSHRLLRAGMDATTSTLIADLLKTWRSWEESLGITIELRLFALVASLHAQFGPRMRDLIKSNTGAVPGLAESAHVFAGLLWQRTAEVKERTYQSHDPFRSAGYTDPSLIRDLVLLEGPEIVEFGAEGWKGDFDAALARSGLGSVKFDHGQENLFAQALFPMIADPIEVDYLLLYPIIVKTVRTDTGTVITFALREVF